MVPPSERRGTEYPRVIMLILGIRPWQQRFSIISLPLFETSNELKKQEKRQNYDRVSDHESQEELGLKGYVRRQQVRESL